MNNCKYSHIFCFCKLGNVRAVISSSYGPGAFTQTQASDYYPFGMALTMEFAAKAAGKALTVIGEVVDKGETDDSKTFTRSNPYLYNGKEEQPMPGKWLDYGARFYDPQLGRWHSIDPACEDGGQESVTPYGYVFNDPIKHKDPDGRFPVWAVVGAALDYGLQVYDNYQNGSTGYNAWVGEVDFLDVTLSSVNPTGKFRIAKTLIVEGVKAAMDISANNGVEVETDATKIVTDAIINTTVSEVTGRITEAGSSEAVKKANDNVTDANKQLTKAERQAAKSPNSTKKAEKADAARSNQQAARNNQVRTQVLNSTVGQAPNATQQATTTATERARKDEEKR